MPKPPILAAPVPNETIASATWGDPVTDAVNGLVTGFSRIGAHFYTTTASSNIATALTLIAINLSWQQFDSDAFFDDVNDRFVIPPGLSGIYELDFGIGMQAVTVGSDYRLDLKKNGSATLMQDQRAAQYADDLFLGVHGYCPLNEGDYLSAWGQGTTASVMSYRNFSLIRVADLPTVVLQDA